MPSSCAYFVEIPGKQHGKLRGGSSTKITQALQSAYEAGAKAVVLPTIFLMFPRLLSTLANAVPPLSEHYFYPVSTAPTITTTKGKKKERI